jgi:regulator of sigma E protease
MNFLVTFFSLITLISLHELGHFFVAKRFGVRVEEFGIGYPPRLAGKKMGDTLYSINLLPFGAFVRLPGELERTGEPGSFSEQPVWQRILIALGGVISFWIITAILLSFIFGIGAPVAVGDEAPEEFKNPVVRVVEVASDSPAAAAGLETNDAIITMSVLGDEIYPDKIGEIQTFTNSHLGESITLTLERGSEKVTAHLLARESPPEGEGPLGIALIRTAIQKIPWYLAPWYGIANTVKLTFYIIEGYTAALLNLSQGQPTGVELVGPIGVFYMLERSQQMGLVYFLNFLAMISLHLAIFNILPIPAVDGGRVLLLAIEGIRKKPIPERIEKRMILFSFAFLLMLMVWVTIRDVGRFF